jgi:hypothetical protein
MAKPTPHRKPICKFTAVASKRLQLLVQMKSDVTLANLHVATAATHIAICTCLRFLRRSSPILAKNRSQSSLLEAIRHNFCLTDLVSCRLPTSAGTLALAGSDLLGEGD